MNATQLAAYESGIATRQTLRRGKRTIYVRFYDVPHGSSPPLPEAGDFLPGETSGACVTADGVSILPVASNEFTGLRVAVTAQQSEYTDKSSGGTFPLGAYWVGDANAITGAVSVLTSGNSTHTQWRFEVPAASWTALTKPSKGDATPAALGGGGTVITRSDDYESVPGFVVCELVCGWTWTTYDALTDVQCQTIMVHKKRTHDSSGNIIVGPVSGQEATQRYVLDVEDEDEPMVQITTTSICASSQLSAINSAVSGHLNDRNSGSMTFNTLTYADGTVLLTGYATGTIDASRSPTGVAAYRLTLTFLARQKVWPLKVDQYIEDLKVLEAPVYDPADLTTQTGTSRVRMWTRRATATASKTIRATYANTLLGLLP